jgi:hypothetical protein
MEVGALTRAQDDVLDLPDYRRRSRRQVRHQAKSTLHTACFDDEALEEVVLPVGHHDVGHRTSPKPKKVAAEGRRDGFKVWKTPFWKRRKPLRAARNAAERQLADLD